MPVSSGCTLRLDDEAIQYNTIKVARLEARDKPHAPPIYAHAEVWWTPVVYMACAARGVLAARFNKAQHVE